MDSYRYVFLGGGMVAGYAAKALVENGLGAGELAIISSDDALPYERPPLSKGYLAGREDEASVFISDATFYESNGIHTRLSAPVTAVDTHNRRLSLRSGEDIGFEQLVIATGSQVRTLSIEGFALPGIHYLRSLDDSRKIKGDVADRGVAVVIGGGFIGMEVASVLAADGLRVTMVFPQDRVWKSFFTPRMSRFFQDYYVERGVSFAPNESVVRLEGVDRVSAAHTKSGARLPAELVVAGIGVTPATSILESSGLELDNGVVVNEFLETAEPGIYAAGDVANFPDLIFGKRRRLEHWDNAVEHGKHIGRLLTGDRKPFRHVSYFFSDVFDLSYEYWGDSTGATSAFTKGNPDDASFSTWWMKDNAVVAAFVMSRPDEERNLAQSLIEAHAPLPADFDAHAEPL
jgi:3-phenylpropionate/trans-cinnamate dioxygenase ferredoxin reductase component